MLSKAPREMKESPQKETLNEEEEMDRDVASAALADSLLSEQGMQTVAKALGSPEPAKAMALIISQVLEPVQVSSMETDTPLSPRVWLAEGGAVDEILYDIDDNADLIGLEEGYIYKMIPQIKQELSGILQSRGKDLQGKVGAQGAPPAQQPVGPAPVPQGVV